jgi:hypothetical protein
MLSDAAELCCPHTAIIIIVASQGFAPSELGVFFLQS